MLLRNICLAVGAAILLCSAPVDSIAAETVPSNTGGDVYGVGFWLDGGVESWDGDITYQIGFPVTDAWGYTYEGYFPFSELEFPLDVVFGSVEAGMVILDRWAIRAELKKSVSDPDDYLKDRDWITGDGNSLDIYSDSDVRDFDATVVDVDATYRFFQNNSVSLAAGIGYMYQDFEYETALIRQWSPSGLTGYDYVGDGSLSLIYDVDIDMPYILLSGKFNIIPALAINGRVAYAPWVNVDNTDQHLLRYKVNEGNLEGTAVMTSADAEFSFTPQFYVAGGVSYTYIEADGDMDATFYGIYDHTVTEEIESNQFNVYARIGFRFGAQ